MNFDISKIKNFDFIRNVSLTELESLTNKIKKYIIKIINDEGGHLSSNVSSVEAIVSVFHVFDYKKDIFIYDTGHQSLAHKILTGRSSKIHLMKKNKCISVFPDMNESEHDKWTMGHAGTGISVGIGYSISNKLNNIHKEIIINIGDGAFVNGVSLESLNINELRDNKIIIILNSNNEGIGELNGNLYNILNRIIFKKKNYSSNNQVFQPNTSLKLLAKIAMINYYGVIPGDNIGEIIKFLKKAKKSKVTSIIHIKTNKGKEISDITVNNTVDNFHKVHKNFLSTQKKNITTYSRIVSDIVFSFYKNDNKVVVLTPGMKLGSYLKKFEEYDKTRFFDFGIAESSLVIIAAVLGCNNLIPFVSIYSTFLQRAYDQLLHDVVISKSHVIFGIDRCSISEYEGSTHHGIYDIGFLLTLPNFFIVSGCCKEMIKKIIYYAFFVYKFYIGIRYDNNKYINKECTYLKAITKPVWILQNKFHTGNLVLISYGINIHIIDIFLKENNISNKVILINAIFINPIDKELLKKLLTEKKYFLFFESVNINNSLYKNCLSFITDNNKSNNVYKFFGLNNIYIDNEQINENIKLRLSKLLTYIKKHAR